jgi:hypothetical protein
MLYYSLTMEAVATSITLVHLSDHTAHTENLSITTTTLLVLFKAIIFLYSEYQAKYKETYRLWHNTFAFKQLVRTETAVGGSLEDCVWKQYRQTDSWYCHGLTCMKCVLECGWENIICRMGYPARHRQQFRLERYGFNRCRHYNQKPFNLSCPFKRIGEVISCNLGSITVGQLQQYDDN